MAVDVAKTEGVQVTDAADMVVEASFDAAFSGLVPPQSTGEEVAKATVTSMLSQMQRNKIRKHQALKTFGRHSTDTGSAEAQGKE